MSIAADPLAISDGAADRELVAELLRQAEANLFKIRIGRLVPGFGPFTARTSALIRALDTARCLDCGSSSIGEPDDAAASRGHKGVPPDVLISRLRARIDDQEALLNKYFLQIKSLEAASSEKAGPAGG